MKGYAGKPNKRMEKRGGKISLIIPAYNEEERLGETLDDYISYFSYLCTDGFEVIVVCNGCDDNTPEIAAKYSQKFHQMIALNISDKIGKGGAIKEGFKIASGDIIGFVDADGAIKPDETWKLLQIVSQGYDGAIGSRWLPGSQVLAKKPLRWRLASRAWNLLVRLFFQLPFKDTQCGAKTFERHVIQSVINDFQINGMTFDVGLLWKATKQGYKIKEVPIIWEHKHKEGLTNNLYKTIIKMAIEIMKLRFKPLSKDGNGINT